MAGRRIVITGASAGVGRAAAHRFARAGACLGLIARDENALADVQAEVEKLGADAVPVATDVADAEAVFRAADEIHDRLGLIDVWINNAMVTVFGSVTVLTPDEFRRVTEVTYLGTVHGTLAALRCMAPRNRGHIIQIGSALAYRGIPLQAPYCAAKHAIRGFTASLDSELVHSGSGIRVSMLELPAVNTPQFDWARSHLPRQPRPVAPVVQPEVIADAVYETVLAPRRETWIGWSTAKTVVGSMLAPRFLDRYLARVAVDGQQTRLPVSPSRKDNLVEPVYELHRTRGSFGAESTNQAMTVSGAAGRLIPVAIGAMAFFVLGALVGRAQLPNRQLLKGGTEGASSVGARQTE
jgi:short-subunit dehydrogenase